MALTPPNGVDGGNSQTSDWRSEIDHPLHESGGLSLYGMRAAYLQRKQAKDPETDELVHKIVDQITQLINELLAKKTPLQGR